MKCNKHICLLLWFFLQVFYAPAQPLPDLIPYTDGVHWGYADSNGAVKIPLRWKKTYFFKDSFANVTTDDGKPNLIDKKGDYILPPSIQWTGTTLERKAFRLLVVTDSTGIKLGLANAATGILVVPVLYDQVSFLDYSPDDDLLEVYENGLAGLITPTGEKILSCRYGEIVALHTSGAARRLFMVSDPDNVSGVNKWGIVAAADKLLVPQMYSNTIYYRHSSKGDGFVALKKVSNTNKDYRKDMADYPFWYPFGQGSPAPFPDSVDNTTDNNYQEFPVGKGLRAFSATQTNNGRVGYGIMDASGKILIPSGISHFTGDTAIAFSEYRAGHDSLCLVIKQYSLANLQRAPDSCCLWTLKPTEDINARRHYYNDGNYREPPYMIWNQQSIRNFYKDSLFYNVVGYADGRSDGSSCIVMGSGPRYKTYYAVVDKQLNYIVPPVANEIIACNLADTIVVISGYDPVAKVAGYGLMDKHGKLVMPFQCHPLWYGLRYKDHYYGVVPFPEQQLQQNEGLSFQDQSKLLDEHGLVVYHTEGLVIVNNNKFINIPKRGLPPGSIEYRDGKNKISILYPDGAAVYPALNGKYYSIDVITKGLFNVRDTNNKKSWRNASNKQVAAIPEGATLLPDTDHNRFVKLYLERDGIEYGFLIDDKGRFYCTDAYLQQLKMTRLP